MRLYLPACQLAALYPCHNAQLSLLCMFPPPVCAGEMPPAYAWAAQLPQKPARPGCRTYPPQSTT